MIRTIPKRNGREFQTFYIRPRSGVDSAQWNWGIILSVWPIEVITKVHMHETVSEYVASVSHVIFSDV